MYTQTRSPAWHRDVIWCAGVVLVLATLVAGAAFAWSRLAQEDQAGPILRETLRATLLPGADQEAPALDVRREEAFTPGEPFEALPGSGVRIDPTEVASFGAGDALNRVAGVWTGVLVDEGAEALQDTVEDPTLRQQVQAVATGPAARLIEAELAEEMLGAGLDDGSRLANWPLQAQQDPGEPVQPIVGLFVFMDPGALQGLSDRQIGEAAVATLADLVVADGADAARDAISNVNLSARFEQAVSQARSVVHDLFAAVLQSRLPALDTRLEEARSVLVDAETSETGLGGILPAAELAGLPPEEANERVLDALAERAWREGPAAVEALLEGDVRAERLASARGVVGAFTRSARDTARTVAWIAGAVALLAFAAMAFLADGVGRLSRPGAAVALGALPGALAAWWFSTSIGADAAALPSGARAEGAFAELAGLVRYLAAAVPAETVTVVLRTHAVLAGVGLGLVLTALILLAATGLRPRRRGYL